MNQFEIFNNTNYEIEELKSVYELLEYACDYLKINNSIFNVIIVSEEEIKKLNKNYRNIDKVTDVISFALEDDNTFIKTDFNVLGDIYICFSRAKEQANLYEHSLKREMCFLALHGLLHLLGYDHMKKDEEKIMFNLQDEILNSFGILR